MRMHNPPHPGKIIKSLCLEPLGVTVTEAAKALGVSRNQQTQYDLWHAEQRRKQLRVMKLAA
jgi:plasmid maintenance system antidote protein VapI